MDKKIQQCIDDCNKCAEVCEETLEHCKEMGGEHADPVHISLMEDCIEICKTSESFMQRDSAHMEHICKECAEICEECADSCESIDPRSDKMMASVEACRACAKSCREMTEE
ncbi:MAG TPA: four-helix bundle copper-binding protein [Candidatus Paceibacterota bacterium]|nr:four-helix bundle copper-binding protein [Candidatus Paceibacterota bacterium]